jgi:quercetin dioxygenase-like cupin family protein
MSTASRENGRLRQHPLERFAQPVRKLNLDEHFDALLAESHEPTDGHRQITISHEDGLTQTLVHFEQGSGLGNHTVNGIVTLHVLEGHLEVTAQGEDSPVESGELLTLSRGVEFSVIAHDDTKLLLTVHLAR